MVEKKYYFLVSSPSGQSWTKIAETKFEAVNATARDNDNYKYKNKLYKVKKLK